MLVFRTTAEQLDQSSTALSAFSESDDLEDIVQRKIREEISTQLGISVDDVRIEHLGMGNSRRCNGAETVLLRLSSNEDFRGSVPVFVEAYKNDRLCGRWNLRTRVAIWESVYVAAMDLSVGDDIIVDRQRMRRDQLRGDAISDPKSKIANRAITKGEVVLTSHVRIKPDQYRGDSVIVIYESGSLRIRTEGKLMSDAQIGDEVKISSQSTNSVLKGILAEDGMVYIKRQK